MKKKLILIALRTVLWKIALWWCKSLKIVKVNHEQFEELRAGGENYVVAFWHGSMLVGWFLHRPVNGKKVSALVSQSKDGEYLSTVLERWGYTMIRGSSHIGGKEAMQLMTEEIEHGSSLVITPDGPRGPRHEMKMGAVRAAQKTNVPLVLVGIAAKKKRNLKSWDTFEVPMPFTEVAISYSEPIMVPKELDGASLDQFKIAMQEKLHALTDEAEAYFQKER